MTNSHGSDRLAQLRDEADRSLRLFLRRTAFSIPTSQEPPDVDRRAAPSGSTETTRDMVRRRATSGSFLSVAGPKKPEAASGTVAAPKRPETAPGAMAVNPMPGSVFQDNERRMRALAKEIKRLITEDKRRGLAVEADG